LTSRRLVVLVALLAMGALAVALGRGLSDREAPGTRPAGSPLPPVPPASATASVATTRPGIPSRSGADPSAERADVGFRSEARLREHYDKHGREFGRISAAEYLALAKALRDRPAGGVVLETTRADGVVSRFDRETGAFLAFERDGTIRTFFKPRDGEAYFRRQAGRSH
jgi:hypothetical protein